MRLSGPVYAETGEEVIGLVAAGSEERSSRIVLLLRKVASDEWRLTSRPWRAALSSRLLWRAEGEECGFWVTVAGAKVGERGAPSALAGKKWGSD
jgi:hypothetical protein